MGIEESIRAFVASLRAFVAGAFVAGFILAFVAGAFVAGFSLV
jgi:hypothetical protein